jgi:hypothetical protein
MPKVGELGVSYLQDGTEAAKDLTVPQPIDYTRKQVGVDLALVPGTVFALRGRTIFDVASHVDAAPGVDRSNIAEHDYTATVRMGSQWVLAGNWAERNYYAYFAGTNLPSLFKPNDNDKFQGWGGNLTWNSAGALQIVLDYRHMDRQTYGITDRTGGEVRWSTGERALMIGGGLHFVNAPETLNVDGTAPAKSLSHKEGRIWVMGTKGKFTGSLDGIVQVYEEGNRYLAGLTSVYEVIASLGYQASTNLKVSGDLSYGSTPESKNETRGLLKAEYRFGFGKKGGQ